MPWPSLSDYNEAVQNPQHCFEDPELRAGTIRTNPMGLPIPISGGFATVYQVQCGPRVWAVRCFQREVLDQQQRYAAISKHLEAVRLPYTVGFTYLAQGIRVRGQWFPVLKMEWVDGQPLNIHIERSLKDPVALRQLADHFLSMVVALQQANIAHGDLQHGNIVAANGSLKLIDYDGMYVPTLSCYQSNEVGHRNYQHPKRSADDFGPNLDNFSVWVIYLSILALSIDANLWPCTGAGEESLLFRSDDFEKPHASAILALLTKHADPRLQGLASLFASALYSDPSHVPPLQAAPVAASPPPAPVPPSTADWLKDHLGAIPHDTSIPNAASSPAPPATNTDWLLDFVSPPQAPKPFADPLLAPRLSIAALLAAAVIVVGLDFTLPLGAAFLCAIGVPIALLIAGCYQSDPAVVERKALLEELRRLEGESAGGLRAQADVRSQTSRLHAESNKTRQALAKERAVLQQKERQELASIQARAADVCRAIDAQIADLQKPLQRVRSDATALTSRLQQRLASLNQAENGAISSALRLAQQQFTADFLQRYRVDSSHITGIGPTLAARLVHLGYRTAADIDRGVTSVPGIGSGKASSLIAWRRAVEQRAIVAMPQSLPSAQLQGIQASYRSQRLQLQQQIDSVTQTARQQEQAILAHIGDRVRQLQQNRTDAQRQSQEQLQAVSRRYQQAFSDISQREAQAKAHLERELKRVEGETIQARKQEYERNWRLAKARRLLDPYSQITPIGYLEQVLGWPWVRERNHP